MNKAISILICCSLPLVVFASEPAQPASSVQQAHKYAPSETNWNEYLADWKSQLRSSKDIPPEPDWSDHIAYWKSQLHPTFEPPKVGQKIEVTPQNGIVQSGKIVSITREYVTLEVDKGTITFNRQNIRLASRRYLFEDDYVTGKAMEKIKQEKDVYLACVREIKERGSQPKVGPLIANSPSLLPPLQLVAAYNSRNVIGEREFGIEVRNISKQTIVAYEATIACFTRFGDPVQGFLDSSNEINVISQDRIEPGTTEKTTWTLHFRDTAAVKKVRINRVKIADGRIWTPTPGHEICATYEDK